MRAASTTGRSQSAGRPGALDPAGAECTCFKLRSLSRQVTRFYDRILAPAGLKVTQYSVLGRTRACMAAGRAPTVSELAEALNTDRTTLTRNLGPLIDAGWLKVGDGPDARSKAVSLTPAGEAALRHARGMWREAERRLRETAADSDIDQLHTLIDRLLPRLTHRSSFT
ncbi:MAG: winged helix-turn-helix transcriptional regulator [Burkholderiales bacterium]|nr:winged helix-turn-helix transcriptional regulator [Burkholderiales bacterium]